MNEHYLKVCLRDFDKTTQRRYGEVGQLLKIEIASQHMRNREVSIEEIHRHFRQYENQKWLRPYWLWPSIENLSEVKDKTCDFRLVDTKANAEENAEKVTRVLLEAFRQIELVSLILRFVCPEYFGIFAPPVAYMLSLLSGENAVDTYIMYLDNLREIQERCDFSTICDTENALWVLQHKCGKGNDADNEIKQQFEQDAFMSEIRAKNMTSSWRLTVSARFAKVLFDADNELAALVGCYALELNVKELSEHENVERLLTGTDKGLTNRLKLLMKKGSKCFKGINQNQIWGCITTRNDIIHLKPYTRGQLEQLINFALKIEEFLDRRR